MPRVKSSVNTKKGREAVAKQGRPEASHLKNAPVKELLKGGRSIQKSTNGFGRVIMTGDENKESFDYYSGRQHPQPKKKSAAQKKAEAEMVRLAFIKFNKSSKAPVKKAKRSPNAFTDTLNVSAIEQAGSVAAKKAMALMGYAIIAQNGWIVKKFADGKTVQLHKI